MRNFKRALATLFIFLLGVGVLLFVIENQQTVTLIIFGWSAPTMPIAVPIIVALLIGLAVAPFLVAYTLQRDKRRARRVVRAASPTSSA